MNYSVSVFAMSTKHRRGLRDVPLVPNLYTRISETLNYRGSSSVSQIFAKLQESHGLPATLYYSYSRAATLLFLEPQNNITSTTKTKQIYEKFVIYLPCFMSFFWSRTDHPTSDGPPSRQQTNKGDNNTTKHTHTHTHTKFNTNHFTITSWVITKT